MAKDLVGNEIKTSSLIHVTLPEKTIIARVVHVAEGVILAQIQIPVRGAVVGEILTVKEPSPRAMKRVPSRTLCRLCKKRPALFKYEGEVKRDKHHDLCMQCFRSWDDKNKARILYQ